MNKPDWALMMQNARDLERQAQALRQEALDARCREMLGGARCTADLMPEHAHRYHAGELP
jgi:hypothetical protein